MRLKVYLKEKSIFYALPGVVQERERCWSVQREISYRISRYLRCIWGDFDDFWGAGLGIPSTKVGVCLLVNTGVVNEGRSEFDSCRWKLLIIILLGLFGAVLMGFLVLVRWIFVWKPWQRFACPAAHFLLIETINYLCRKKVNVNIHHAHVNSVLKVCIIC